MKRFASHFIFFPPAKVLKLHVVELDEDHRISSIFPLDKETANTSFFNGVILFSGQEIVPGKLLQALREGKQKHPEASVCQLLEDRHFPEIKEKDSIYAYHLERLDFCIMII
jgi:hypothetical protein